MGSTAEMVRIRASRRSDLSIIASWIDSQVTCRLWCGARVPYPIDLASLPGAIEFAMSDPWTATSEGLVVAFGQLVPKPGERLHLARLIAAPSHRRTGLGRRMARHLLGVALSHDPPAISLNVFSENEAALHLYQSLGFRAATRPRDESDSTSIYMEYAI